VYYDDLNSKQRKKISQKKKRNNINFKMNFFSFFSDVEMFINARFHYMSGIFINSFSPVLFIFSLLFSMVL